MIDKIPDRISQSYTQAVGQQEGSRPVPNGRENQAPSTEVTLSAEALVLQKAQNAVKEAPDVREDKVTALRQQIDNGTYQVDEDKLAARLVDLLA